VSRCTSNSMTKGKGTNLGVKEGHRAVFMGLWISSPNIRDRYHDPIYNCIALSVSI
jgi:hypothetical protein